MILDRIQSPEDLKKLNQEELPQLANEMRNTIIQKVSQTGGHLGPNLGMIEATIALHYVFNSPIDKIVYDVSHQSYPHKILTGRKHGFLVLNNSIALRVIQVPMKVNTTSSQLDTPPLLLV